MAETKEAHLAYTRTWQRTHRERMRALQRKWRATHPVEHATLQHRANNKRRMRVVGNGGWHTAADWAALVHRCDGRCVACGAVGKQLERDHIVPLSKGGTDNIDNLQPLCVFCNRSKADGTIDYRSAHVRGAYPPIPPRARPPRSRPSHCQRGHGFTPEDTIVYRDGRRACRVCKRTTDRARGRPDRPRKPLVVRTHCKRGHEYTPQNTRVVRRRWRGCKECDRAWHKLHRHTSTKVA